MHMETRAQMEIGMVPSHHIGFQSTNDLQQCHHGKLNPLPQICVHTSCK